MKVILIESILIPNLFFSYFMFQNCHTNNERDSTCFLLIQMLKRFYLGILILVLLIGLRYITFVFNISDIINIAIYVLNA